MTAPEIVDDLRGTPVPLFDLDPNTHTLSLADRFIFPPFSLLDSRAGPWQDRKRLWIELGIRSEEGREANTYAKGKGTDEVSQKILTICGERVGGKSVFDPVLCEMAYRWFCPPLGLVLDPFAGGSVRGLVAAITRRRYHGIDLSERQIDANYEQAIRLEALGMIDPDYAPFWTVGDSAELDRHGPDVPADFVWSCPPYGDLEVYSDDPRDLSTMAWREFCATYRDIIGRAVDALGDDRFAAFVVGEIRDKEGLYRNFIGETINAFEAAGAAYYNEALFVTPAGTLPVRTAKQFVTTRKLGRCHQNVLVFCKGDPRRATAACSDPVAEAAALKAAGRDAEVLAMTDEAEPVESMAHG